MKFTKANMESPQRRAFTEQAEQPSIPTSVYFLPETLKRISQLELRARCVVEGFLNGLHKSRHFGNSVEFRQHRQYVHGDDPRNVDWKVWARQNRLYVKQYEIDTNFRLTILLDVSDSMRYGNGPMNKYEYACTTAASLAYLAIKQQDAVGCITFDKKTETQIPSKRKFSQLNILASVFDKANAGRLKNNHSSAKKHLSLSEIIENFGNYQPNFHDAILSAAETIPKYGVVVIISDLLSETDGLFQGCRYLRSCGHDVLVLHILDDDELDFSFNGPVLFEGLEIPAAVRCDPRSIRKEYLSSLNTYLEKLKHGFSKDRVNYSLFRTSTPLDAALAKYLCRMR